MNKKSTLYLPLFIVFVLVFTLVVVFKNYLVSKEVNTNFILGANFVLFALSIAGLFIQSKGAGSENLNAFLRGIYTSLLMKMLLIVGGILVYITLMGGEVNRPAIFIGMALYFIFTAIEIKQIMKIVRQKKDGEN
ncbi:MAG: hypothetical protein ABIW47_12560 [Ginsengibacter sp.]|jgi:hypothetical protein